MTDADTPTVIGLPKHARPACGSVIDDPDRLELTRDGDHCNYGAAQVVDVGGVEVAACGHHIDAAEQAAADRADVEIADLDIDRDRPRVEEYDVEATLAELDRQRDDGDTCVRCGTTLVPSPDDGLECPACESWETPDSGLRSPTIGTFAGDADD